MSKAMIDPLPIQPVTGPIDAVVHVPGSKSITNRALILAALADGRSALRGALFSDDTRYMSAALHQLGIAVQSDERAASFVVDGCGGSIPVESANLFVGNSGTSARFLTAMFALGHGRFRLDGSVRMRQRPIQDLLDSLRQLGVDAESEMGTGCPPVTVRANGFMGGTARLRGDVSSQFLSALLMVAPLSRRGVEIEIGGELASEPYVNMTLRMMEQWGARVVNDSYRRLHVPGDQRFEAREYVIEPDASAACYFWAAAAVTGGRARVEGIGCESLQGDVAFVDILERMGCAVKKGANHVEVQGPDRLRGVDEDMNGTSDQVMTLAAIAPFADSPTTLRHIGHIRHKETDRLAAVAAELARLGVRVEERGDGITVWPAQEIRPAAIETYDDHRMAMSFAVAGLRASGISIKDPGCVAKTFPDFFERLGQLAVNARQCA